MLKKTVREHKIDGRSNSAVSSADDIIAPAFVVTEEMHAAVNKTIVDTFRLFSDAAERLKDDLYDFNKKQKEIRATIKNGARRTDGRIRQLN